MWPQYLPQSKPNTDRICSLSIGEFTVNSLYGIIQDLYIPLLLPGPRIFKGYLILKPLLYCGYGWHLMGDFIIIPRNSSIKWLSGNSVFILDTLNEIMLGNIIKLPSKIPLISNIGICLVQETMYLCRHPCPRWFPSNKMPCREISPFWYLQKHQGPWTRKCTPLHQQIPLTHPCTNWWGKFTYPFWCPNTHGNWSSQARNCMWGLFVSTLPWTSCLFS